LWRGDAGQVKRHMEVADDPVHVSNTSKRWCRARYEEANRASYEEIGGLWN